MLVLLIVVGIQIGVEGQLHSLSELIVVSEESEGEVLDFVGVVAHSHLGHVVELELAADVHELNVLLVELRDLEEVDHSLPPTVGLEGACHEVRVENEGLKVLLLEVDVGTDGQVIVYHENARLNLQLDVLLSLYFAPLTLHEVGNLVVADVEIQLLKVLLDQALGEAAPPLRAVDTPPLPNERIDQLR
eukprot:CAMPEP_0168623622 /NCGR_PEP_ID=MMETSP0449_2-20121227/8928_1 /TAXON_ID=1082188 /ORGANISM="Strombidium rassoulzadegani, Strain ras09" /LENGTH=188 /DNA_ID=CAMNT_0008665025 /DNA_START=201 /DNA_END=764 /DNA_ORIENTATION=-